MCWLLYVALDRAARPEEDPTDARSRAAACSFAFWIGASLVTLFPIYWMFVISAKSRVELFGIPSFLLDDVLLPTTIVNTLTNPTFQGYMINSIIVATSQFASGHDAGAPRHLRAVALPLAGKENIFFWTITNRMAPPAVFLLPLFLLYTRVFAIGDWKLYDTRIGLILLYCVFNLPFAIWTLRGIIDAIPKELDEAAMVDGASTLAGADPRHHPAGPARPRGHRHPHLGLRLERVPVRGDADERPRAHDHHRPRRIRDRHRHQLGADGGDRDADADPGARLPRRWCSATSLPA